jgi:2-polyprenyl-3-methyl-5-hydroxy-6-metoxy-1,4-benzoquinol methylase
MGGNAIGHRRTPYPGSMDAAGWDARYGAGQQWSTEPNAFFADAVTRLRLEPGRAVDLACGEGRNAVWLARNGWDVLAVDFSAVGIERGRAMAVEAGVDVDWAVADLADFDLGAGSFDLVAHVYLHWPTAPREPFLRRVAASVAPNGHLVLVGHDRTNITDGYGGPQDPDVLTTPEELAATFRAEGLEVLEAHIVVREVTLEPGHGAGGEGTGGEGTGAVRALDHLVIARRV